MTHLNSPGGPLYDPIRDGLIKKAKGGDSPPPFVAAPPAPTASPSSLEVTQAKTDAKRNAKSKQGINSTILAGNNPFAPAGNAGGGNTILGGG